MKRFLLSWRGALLLGLVVLIGLAIAPIPGQLLWVPDHWQATTAWPRVSLNPEVPEPDSMVEVAIADTVPWTNVKLVAGGVPVQYERYEQNAASGYWRWYWSLTLPATGGVPLTFYHDCDTGCQSWATATVGALKPTSPEPTLPTKLGIIFAAPDRDWHHRAGWDVELTYALKADREYWGIDDLALRVGNATTKGLRVLVRVDYDQQQTVPPANDYVALGQYLAYVRRLARDARLSGVYGYIIGNGINARSETTLAPSQPITPDWYARLFNGYGAQASHTDNVVETIRAENATVRVLVGPVRPWLSDANGAKQFSIDSPWLNYMNTLLADLDESAANNEAIGVALTAPDGFAVSAPGDPDSAALVLTPPADEPRADLRRADWNGAQSGFRVYTDWLSVINAYPRFKGLPIYINTNTYPPGSDSPPAQNYPRGWLTNALAVVNAEPQAAALCWFLDSFPMDKQWALFSLTQPQGLLIDAAEEFDGLLKVGP